MVFFFELANFDCVVFLQFFCCWFADSVFVCAKKKIVCLQTKYDFMNFGNGNLQCKMKNCDTVEICRQKNCKRRITINYDEMHWEKNKMKF